MLTHQMVAAWLRTKAAGYSAAAKKLYDQTPPRLRSVMQSQIEYFNHCSSCSLDLASQIDKALAICHTQE